MSVKTVIINSKVSRSKIEHTDTDYILKGIPITVNESVMNGVLYSRADNEAGMASIVGKPITIDHPTDANGSFISALEGEGLKKFYSGGIVTNYYEKDDIWYVDAEINKAMLAAQNGGSALKEKLDSKSDLGVSTGLTIEYNEISGVNPAGKKYKRVAKGQFYNHLAAVNNPAGGRMTTAVFNSENTQEIDFSEMLLNSKQENKNLVNKLFDMIKELIGNESSFNDIQDLISSKLKAERATKPDEFLYPSETYDTFFIYRKDGTMLKQVYMNDDGVITFVGEPKAVVKDVDWKEIKSDLNTNEDNAMRTEMLAELKAAEITVNAEIANAELMAKYKESLTANSAAGTGDSKLLDAINALTAKVDAMEKTKLTAEEEAKAKKAKELAANSAIAGLGFVEADLLKMETNRLDDLYAKHSGQIVGNAYAGIGTRAEGVAEIDLNSLLQGAE